MADINFFDPKRMARFEQEERARQAAAGQAPAARPRQNNSQPQTPAQRTGTGAPYGGQRQRRYIDFMGAGDGGSRNAWDAANKRVILPNGDIDFMGLSGGGEASSAPPQNGRGVLPQASRAGGVSAGDAARQAAEDWMRQNGMYTPERIDRPDGGDGFSGKAGKLGPHTSPERDELIRRLDELSRYEGYATTVEQANAVSAEKEEILARLHEIDIGFGNPARAYTEGERAGAVVGGAVKQYGGDMANAIATLGRFGNEYVAKHMDDPAFTTYANPFETAEEELKKSEAATERVHDTGDRLSESAAKDIARAKEGLSALGQAGVDIAVNLIQMGADAAGRTVGLGMIPLIARSAGGGAREARNEGASTGEQLLYGLSVGGIEAATEKLFDGVAGLFGKGVADDIIEGLIGKLAKSDTGRSVLRALSGSLGEGAEEVMSDLLNPLAQLFYKDHALKEAWDNRAELRDEMVYDFLIGAAIGGLGQVGSVATGQNAKKNAALRAVETLRAEDGQAGSSAPPQSASTPKGAEGAQKGAGGILDAGGINTQAEGQNAVTGETEKLNRKEEANHLREEAEADRMEESRLDEALKMQKLGASPSEIYEATGLISMANGDISDGIGGEIIWRHKNDRHGESGADSEMGIGRQEAWHLEEGVSGDVGRGADGNRSGFG